MTLLIAIVIDLGPLAVPDRGLHWLLMYPGKIISSFSRVVVASWMLHCFWHSCNRNNFSSVNRWPMLCSNTKALMFVCLRIK